MGAAGTVQDSYRGHLAIRKAALLDGLESYAQAGWTSSPLVESGVYGTQDTVRKTDQ